MMKKTYPLSNNFCPQTLFLYGTYDDNGKADFGLFCWFSYCWDKEMGVMACIGGPKMTKDRILKNGVFSANLVTESILPLADYLGNTDGYRADKMSVDINIEKGQVLNVPTLADSPFTYELEVSRRVELDDGDIFVCKVRNITADERLLNDAVSVEERIRAIAPVSTTCQTYFTWDGRAIGAWGEPGKLLSAR